MQEVNFVRTTVDNFNKETEHNPNNIYFTIDSKELFLGGEKISSAFVIADETHPLPIPGAEGVFYLDKTKGSFAIRIWDSINEDYVELPIADRSYLKSLSRDADHLIGTKGDSTQDVVDLDSSLSETDIDSLFG